MPSLGAWIWELPWVVGVLGGLALLWLRGALLVLDGSVSGYHWPEWLHNGWHVVHGRWDRMSGFRKPLHGYLVGMLGEGLGYADAAILVSSLSGVVVVVSAGVVGRVLGGPAAGGLAALTVGGVPLVANATHWGTGYPMLAAATGAAMAAAVGFAARPSRGLLAAVAVCTTWALATEDRGVLVVPWVVGMVSWGALRSRRVGWWAGGLALATTLLAPPLLDHALGHRPPFALSTEAKRQAQKEVVHRWLRIEPAPDLVRACREVREAETLEPRFFTTRCARAVLAYNSTTIAPKATVWPVGWLGVALGVWGLGGRVRRHRWLVWTGAATAGGAWLLFAAATPMPHRYILQFVVPLAVVVPVALGRVGGGLRRDWGGWAVSCGLCLAAGGWAWWADPHDRSGTWQRSRGDWSEARWADDAALVAAHVPDDEAVLDCADHGVNSALLPAHVTGPAPFLAPDAGFCRDWVTDATRFGAARRWVTVSTTTALFDKGRKERLELDALLAATSGWRRVDGTEGFELWVRDP